MELETFQVIPVRTMNEIIGAVSVETPTTGMGGVSVGGRFIGATFEGGTFRTADSGARVEIFPAGEPTLGIAVYDDASAEVFKTIISGTDVGDVIMGDATTPTAYAKWDKSAGTFTIYGSAADKLIITNPTMTGLQAGSEIAIQGWQHDMVFSATDHDTVAWGSGTITLMDGTTYSIDAGDTGTMSAINYIFLDIADSTTVLQKSVNLASDPATGSGRILIAVAENVASGRKAVFQVFGGKALGGFGALIVAANVAANVITANEIYANTITATQIAVETITATEISTGLYTLIDESFPSDATLMAYWSFDEGAGLVANDVSGNARTGTLEAGMTDADWVTGVAGTSLDFDGTDDYVGVDPAFLIALTTGSISFWAKVDEDDDAHNHAFSISNDTVVGTYLFINFDFTVGTGRFRIDLSTDTTLQWQLFTVEGVLAPLVNTWVHVVLTHNGTIPKLYLNGVLQTASWGTETDKTKWFKAILTDATTDADVITIGGWRNDSGFIFPFDGKIDEVRIYSNELTAKEISALYKNPQGNTGAVIPIGRLISGSIFSKQITLAVVDGTGNSFIAAGKTDFTNTVAGFILGIDDDVAGNPAKFLIGDSTHYLNWTGTALNVAGAAITGPTITGGTIQTAASGQRVVIDGSTNKIIFYSGVGEVGSLIGATGKITMTGTWEFAGVETNMSAPIFRFNPAGTDPADIASPAEGMVAYDSPTDKLMMYNGSSEWEMINTPPIVLPFSDATAGLNVPALGAADSLVQVSYDPTSKSIVVGSHNYTETNLYITHYLKWGTNFRSYVLMAGTGISARFNDGLCRLGNYIYYLYDDGGGNNFYRRDLELANETEMSNVDGVPVTGLLATDGTYIYACDASDPSVLQTWSVDGTNITLEASVSLSAGYTIEHAFCCNGTYGWGYSATDKKIYQFRVSDGVVLTANNIDLTYDLPIRGMWLIDKLIWVAYGGYGRGNGIGERSLDRIYCVPYQAFAGPIT